MAPKYGPISWVTVIFSLMLLLIVSVSAVAVAELGQRSSQQSGSDHSGQVRRILQVSAGSPPSPARNYNYRYSSSPQPH